ncbi:MULTISPECIES: Rrf2 family transcriptional regulator [unclassified Paenibacillus]|uniref:Rrf2 family transcriptional regulator n=1 Tax=unclassified Paenibacillus TaxID=185978 RepID=UPI0009557BF5|nr:MULTISPECIES: Rrf2 family transcriptional regulator [unclassified Paenibacillus]ASS66928.1 Rrf2 family transcriptional regulator [Paenibacillus sp. RUD330]SIR51818.1 DNA-binding transcriptional regulator, IscR family [Paenibacillus sp. RU4X]SIR60739.1 DNA-binding transcriptional regulator, IscR family [Paenibacillus sp. RU4T]
MKQISSRFSIAVHILTLVSASAQPCTGDFLAGSVNTNPVIIRKILGMLKKARLVDVRAGTGGASLARGSSEITLLDVYRAVEAAAAEGLFSFHDHPNPACEIGRGIEGALQAELRAAQAALEGRLAAVTIESLQAGILDGPA